METYQKSNEKITRQFRSKIWERREHSRKAEWINNMEIELQVVEEGPLAKTHDDSLRTIQEVPNSKTPGYMSIMDTVFKKNH